ncbi:hypothetical protein RAG23_13570 [Klebsiella quasipneumoniae subsp. similipneumoniae]
MADKLPLQRPSDRLPSTSPSGWAEAARALQLGVNPLRIADEAKKPA